MMMGRANIEGHKKQCCYERLAATSQLSLWSPGLKLDLECTFPSTSNEISTFLLLAFVENCGYGYPVRHLIALPVSAQLSGAVCSPRDFQTLKQALSITCS